VNPDQLAELEEQRRFLLRSITDLEREHRYGDVDDHDFETLRDGYTARAASVLRAIEAGRSEAQPRRPRRPRVIAVWVVGTLAVASLSGWLVARTSGQRLPGQSISGGLPGDEIALKLAEARQFLNVDPQQAIIRYQQVRELDPNNAEALTYIGWLIAQSGTDAAPSGAEFLRGAIKLAPTYADPHCFLAITSADYLVPPDLATARTEAQACLDNDPPSQMIGLIQGFVDRLGPPATDPTDATTSTATTSG
jgi:cytochrome c-type biogenesis protein CcmH/NrfG